MPRSAWMKRSLFVACALVAIAAIVAGCGGGSSSSSGSSTSEEESAEGGGGGGSEGGSYKIALLLPENETPRYETDDKPDFEKAIEANAKIQAELLRTSSTVIRDAFKGGKLKVESGVYDLATGKVTLS